MSSRYSMRTRSAAKRGNAAKVPSHRPDNIDTSILCLPEDLCDLLYMERDMLCIRYTQLEQYFTARNRNLARATDMPRPKSRSNLFIDICYYPPAAPPLPSVNILPYIWLYLTFKHIRFHFITESDTVGQGITELASLVYNYAATWQKFILDSGAVDAVQIWWKERCLDIALKRDSPWALCWNCDDKYSGDDQVLKGALGLLPRKPGQWKGIVAVASVEE